jgi:hypothetical protein
MRCISALQIGVRVLRKARKQKNIETDDIKACLRYQMALTETQTRIKKSTTGRTGNLSAQYFPYSHLLWSSCSAGGPPSIYLLRAIP